MQDPGEPIRREIVTWEEVDKLIDLIVPQVRSVGGFDGMVIITRGGIIPGGMLAEALDLTYVLTAAVRFSDPLLKRDPGTSPLMFGLPSYLQFPDNDLLRGRKVLVVDDVWGSGRTSSAVRGRCEAAGAQAYICTLHYNPYRSVFKDDGPAFYGAVTDAFIVYPWEVDRGTDRINSLEPQF
ncbi:MAG: phosphoribosyltransferase [Anaerolineae bacterium]|nr:phosphoribosyltransferase [Anaerolineae bacterium]